VTVTLTYAGDDGYLGTADDETQTTTTDSNGVYTFTNLLPGDYQIVETNPEGYLSLSDADSPSAIGDPDNISTELGVAEAQTGLDFEDGPAAITLVKTRTSFSPVGPGDLVRFEVEITNSGEGWITVLPMRDVFTTPHLSYEGASPEPDAVAGNELAWHDLTGPSPNGFDSDLAPEASVTVVISFTSVQDTTALPGGQALNTAVVDGAVADVDGPGPLVDTTGVPRVEDSDGVQILTPTGIEGVILAGFGAEVEDGDDAVVLWRTESEVEILGFHVVRKFKGMEGGFEAVSELIPATYSGQDVGAEYVWVDQDLPGGAYQYRLQIVGLDGGLVEDGLAEVLVASWRTCLPWVTK
jgi:hypothetical protein